MELNEINQAVQSNTFICVILLFSGKQNSINFYFSSLEECGKYFTA